ncbi:type II toxin-antitoxin system RelE/ParE family toxin [Myroides odoratimimus]|uniref:type II toxin-antitoxin system RelE/ParE family toxin n=1 Tax=Myroides odoratimimus TaxID=76832 RepID=UPI002575C625|nr:type II toxin-antitoxin system RelE/ParE family toxin [Myroides odoratimimus]MDM1398619.1 type II toxin-antitoxin system RelE/ParE family toxin [Myroides odoratimimus]
MVKNSNTRVKEIHSYYKFKSQKARDKIIQDFKSATNALSQFPEMGTLELILADGSVNYRYILVRNIYKIIYFIEVCTVFIVTIWDCRQEKNYI